MTGMHSALCGCLKQNSVSEQKHLPQGGERELGKASYQDDYNICLDER